MSLGGDALVSCGGGGGCFAAGERRRDEVAEMLDFQNKSSRDPRRAEEEYIFCEAFEDQMETGGSDILEIFSFGVRDLKTRWNFKIKARL